MAPQGGTTSAQAVLQQWPVPSTPQTPEAPYSGWNVAGLVCCAVLLLMTGMMMYDLSRNMWQWDSVGKTNVSIFDSIEKTIGWIGDK